MFKHEVVCIMGIRGPDKTKRKTKKCKATLESVHSIHEHIKWYGDERGYVPPCVAEPTNEQPGSIRKLEVLRSRAERGESLWNSDDLTPE